ncbi:MAG: dihydropteroate synthase [Planctomycetota bacterium]
MSRGSDRPIAPRDGFLVRPLQSDLELERLRGALVPWGTPLESLDPDLLFLIDFASAADAQRAAASLADAPVQLTRLSGGQRTTLLLRGTRKVLASLRATEPPALALRLREAATRTGRDAPRLVLPDRTLVLDRPHIMGIVNVTPDSFYDGGRYADAGRAVGHALDLVGEGADIVDIGGQSSRPGSQEVSAAEELRRVLPVVQAVAKAARVPISVDTSRAEVACACADAGATILNDIRGLRGEDALIELAAKRGLGAILMHMRGTPATMQTDLAYDDLMGDILWYLGGSVRLALEGGVGSESLSIDPGIGFGKSADQNLEILRRLHEFSGLGLPITVGASRKSFIGQTLDRPADDRILGTHATTALAAAGGAHILRVHDVKETRDVARMAHAIARAGGPTKGSGVT